MGKRVGVGSQHVGLGWAAEGEEERRDRRGQKVFELVEVGVGKREVALEGFVVIVVHCCGLPTQDKHPRVERGHDVAELQAAAEGDVEL